MKIIVYNHSDQYALSRKQVEAIRAVLPSVLWARIAEFHLCEDRRNTEMFEYSEDLKVVFFSCPVKEKTNEVVALAIQELLIGLARLKAHSGFYLPLKEAERLSYQEFVAQWLPKCIAATTKKS
jgi:hypothetical protein